MIWAIIITGAIALSARLTPFIFAKQLSKSRFVREIGQKLPPAIMILLVAYTLADRPFLAYPYGIPELLGIGAVVGMHLWRHNMILSILAGVGTYQVLIYLM